MRWALLAIVGLGGCDSLWSIDHVEPGFECPSDYVHVGDSVSQYRYESTSKPWEEAEGDCTNDKDGFTHLVVLDSLEEVDAVRSLVTDATPYNMHVGFARNTVAAGGDPLVFYSVTGDPVVIGSPAYDLWETGEPNNYMGIETTTFIEDDVVMRDGEPTRMARFVCECDGVPARQMFTLR